MFNVLIYGSDEEILGAASFRIRLLLNTEEVPFCLFTADSWIKLLIKCDDLQEIDFFIFDLRAEKSELNSICKSLKKKPPTGIVLIIFDVEKKISEISWSDVNRMCGCRGFFILNLRKLNSSDFDLIIKRAIFLYRLKRNEWLEITSERRKLYLQPSDIIYCEIYQKVLTIYCRGNYVRKSNISLRCVEEKLSEKGFLRIHKSYLVNLNCVEALTARYMWLRNGKCLPLGGRYREKVIRAVRNRNEVL